MLRELFVITEYSVLFLLSKTCACCISSRFCYGIVSTEVLSSSGNRAACTDPQIPSLRVKRGQCGRWREAWTQARALCRPLPFAGCMVLEESRHLPKHVSLSMWWWSDWIWPKSSKCSEERPQGPSKSERWACQQGPQDQDQFFRESIVWL